MGKNVKGKRVDVAGAVIGAVLDAGGPRLACELLAAKPNREQVGTFLESTLLAGALVAVRFFVKSGSWADMTRAAENADFGELTQGVGGAVKELLRSSESRAAILRTVVEELARSPERVAETPDCRSPVSEFLHRTFIGKGGWYEHCEVKIAKVERARSEPET